MRFDFGETTRGGPVDVEKARVASDCLIRDGYVILDGVVAVEKITALNEAFGREYARYLRDSAFAETLKVGDRRYLVPIALAGAFADRVCFANPAVIAVVWKTLGRDAILESFGAVVALAGSEEQHVHRDGGSPIFGDVLSPLLPPYALTMALPLLEMNETHGATAIWPGSHRSAQRPDEPPETPTIPLGSCLIWDYRTFHGGTANVSPRHRPLLYGTYARSWFRDTVNFIHEGRRRLVFDRAFLDKTPDELRGLFAHVSGESRDGPYENEKTK